MDHPTPTIHLNPHGVIAPMLWAMNQTAEIVAIALPAVELADLDNLPDCKNYPYSTIRFDNRGVDAALRKREHAIWILNRAVADLARGAREALEEACLYLDLLDMNGDILADDLEVVLSGIRRAGNKLSFPGLVQRVKGRLSSELAFEQELLSLQRVRNCLEHRGGIVGEQDVDASTGKLELTLPALRTFLRDEDGVETELVPGLFVEKASQILVRVESTRRLYAAGDRVTFLPAEFNEIAAACLFFANDLGGKLPNLSEGA